MDEKGKTYRYGLSEHLLVEFVEKLTKMTSSNNLDWECLNILPENYDTSKLSQLQGIVKYRTKCCKLAIIFTVKDNTEYNIDVMPDSDNSRWYELEFPQSEEMKTLLCKLNEMIYQKVFYTKDTDLKNLLSCHFRT